ncbi:uncharacterized protein LOC115929868 [Strongylocentrotus purpuratus]|uniref:Uncharacterized protein n=1 Tax=Strongylocentrotus purpuratus TaxID=7668 RepID=A0A7M7PSL5_STRPU|nr:uncharacterized protein LOC115929868 [Strongylocentrotus purpuratus]
MKLIDKMASCSVTLEQNHPRSPCIIISKASNKPSSPLHHICEQPHFVPPDESRRETIETMVCQKTESDQLLDTIPEETTELSPAREGNDNQSLVTSEAVVCTKTESDHLLEPLPEGIADVSHLFLHFLYWQGWLAGAAEFCILSGLLRPPMIGS